MVKRTVQFSFVLLASAASSTMFGKANQPTDVELQDWYLMEAEQAPTTKIYGQTKLAPRSENYRTAESDKRPVPTNSAADKKNEKSASLFSWLTKNDALKNVVSINDTGSVKQKPQPRQHTPGTYNADGSFSKKESVGCLSAVKALFGSCFGYRR